MPHIQIKNDKTKDILYDGVFKTIRDCVEQAVSENVCLDEADLRYANLANAALDDAMMRHARLDHANLAGANLSEACLTGTSFVAATMVSSCLCYAGLDNCNFSHVLFGATDITGCSLQKSRFADLSAFTLNFVEALTVDHCIYRTSDGMPCSFSNPPLVIQGLDYPVILTDRHLHIGAIARSYSEWFSSSSDQTVLKDHVFLFFQKHQDVLFQLYLKHAKDPLLLNRSSMTA